MLICQICYYISIEFCDDHDAIVKDLSLLEMNRLQYLDESGFKQGVEVP